MNPLKSLKLSEANKTIALAGIFQSAFLLHQTAFNQTINPKAFQTSIESIFKINTADTLSVYGEVHDLHLGLLILTQLMSSAQPHHSKKILLRYLLGFSTLAKKILSNPKIFSQIQRRLASIILQAAHLGSTHEFVISELGGLYRQVFLSQNIQIPVMGKSRSFKNKLLLNQIYALIISGIRSAVLWHQLSGSKLELFFSQSRLKKQAAFLLDNGQTFFLSHTSNA